MYDFFFTHTMPHLFPPTVIIVVKMSSPHCRMQKEGGFLMRLPCFLIENTDEHTIFVNVKTTHMSH